MRIEISTSTRADKKLMAVANGKTVHFGQKGAGDYTLHKDAARKDAYIARHASTENWTRSGMLTPGFLSKHLLWNKPTLAASIADLNKRYKGTTFVRT
jgi:hypothetical protein